LILALHQPGAFVRDIDPRAVLDLRASGYVLLGMEACAQGFQAGLLVRDDRSQGGERRLPILRFRRLERVGVLPKRGRGRA
jgi:hypothetical protein